MARARNIKPGFFTNDTLAECNPLARILFAGLWCHADRAGRLENRPKKLKAEILPYDDCNIDELIAQLEFRKFILCYSVDGKNYIQILEFKKHQNPHRDEKQSILPEHHTNDRDNEIAPCKHSISTVQELEMHSCNRADSLNLSPDSLNLSPETSPRKARGDYTPEFEQAWSEYPERPGASKKDSFKQWNSRIKAGATVDQLMTGVRNYAAYVRIKKTEPEYIKQPTTFFGPAEHYLADWTPSQPRASPDSKLGKAGQVTAQNAQRWLEEQDAGN